MPLSPYRAGSVHMSIAICVVGVSWRPVQLCIIFPSIEPTNQFTFWRL